MKRQLPFLACLIIGYFVILWLTRLPVARWWQLQGLGQVPEQATRADWEIAEWTTWWGKRIDPKEFWRDRVIWNDENAEMAARKRGRRYPPIPEHRPDLMAGFSIASRSQKEHRVSGRFAHSDYGPVTTDAEHAYWDWFRRTKPNPPELLQRNLHWAVQNPERAVQKIGLPPEAVTREALSWLTANPVTEDQVRAAKQWKIAYLSRLRREGWDASYINAYIKAWGLSEADIFQPLSLK